jgi:hypothetical protein
MAAARTIAVLLVLGCLQARSDLKLSVAHNVSATATKLGFTYDTKINSKKTQLKVNYLTKGKAVTGELISSLAPNKKATLAFTDKQVRNVHQGTALRHSPSHSCGPCVVSCTAVMYCCHDNVTPFCMHMSCCVACPVRMWHVDWI